MPIISEAEQRQVLSFCGNKSDYPRDKSIVDLFEEQVKLFSDKTALFYKNESFSYSWLNIQSSRLARTLLDLKITKNTPIGILSDKSPDMIVGLLAILKAGGTYVPIDPDYPKLRIEFLVKDSGCKILFVDSGHLDLEIEGVKKIHLNESGNYVNDHLAPENIAGSDDIAYIMYTSGTTGTPKGCMISHRGVIRLVRNTNFITIQPEDKILSTGASVFDAITFEIWGSLLNGASLYLVENDIILNPKKLEDELIKNNISILWLTSSLFTQIVSIQPNIFRVLKYLIVGGDVLSANHINIVRENNPQLKVINGYGPTENTTFTTTFLINRHYDHSIPIGKPINNSTVYIFDENMNYQPIGVIGELFVGGDGLSKGYINREDLNRICFIEHPGIPGERLYRTGDFGSWLPDGNIEFHGRKDSQLKFNGIRIETGEIEAHICKLEGVKEAVVKLNKFDNSDDRLVAFLNTHESFKTGKDEIIKLLKRTLPAFMVPSYFEIVSEFPLLPNGKVNRSELVYKNTGDLLRDSEQTNTISETEKKLFVICFEPGNKFNYSV